MGTRKFEKGATSVEYALVAALVLAPLLGVVASTGDFAQNTLYGVGLSIAGALGTRGSEIPPPPGQRRKGGGGEGSTSSGSSESTNPDPNQSCGEVCSE